MFSGHTPTFESGGDMKKSTWRAADTKPIFIIVMVLALLWFIASAFQFAKIQNVWIDETTQLSGVRLPLGELIGWLTGAPRLEFGVPPDRMPLVSYILDMAVERLVGANPLPYRLFHISIVVSGLIFLGVALRRQFGTPPALISIILLCTSAKLVDAAAEIRSYPILFALTCGQIVYFLRIYGEDEPSGSDSIKLTALSVISIYTHFFGVVSALAFYSALLVSAKGRRDIQRLAVMSLTVVVLSIGLLPFIKGAASASGNAEVRTDWLTAIPHYLLTLIGHSSTMVWPLGAAALLGGVSCCVALVCARLFSAQGVRRFDKRISLILVLLIGVGATIAGALFAKGFNAIKPSYSIWLLPIIASIAGCVATFARPAYPTGKHLSGALIAVTAAGALYSSVQFFRYSQLFVHGPSSVLIAEIDRAGKGMHVIFEGNEWAYGYFPLYWKYGETLEYWSTNAGGSAHKVLRGGDVQANAVNLSEIAKDRPLLLARIETRNYAGVRELLAGRGRAVELQNAPALQAAGRAVAADASAIGIYSLKAKRFTAVAPDK
jgi:Dolichyl-phosphate-mannose-protein mannosyltransferase